MDDLLIGTSGYDHPELKGSFYPSDLPRKDFLPFYSTKFNALELNSTFYGMPTPARIASIYERSGGHRFLRYAATEESAGWRGCRGTLQGLKKGHVSVDLYRKSGKPDRFQEFWVW